MLPGRTNGQCRQRWVALWGCKWTVEEDAKLTAAVKEHDKDWIRIAELVPGRTYMQCRQRWLTFLGGTWTVEEDAKLAVAVTECGNEWVQVAVLVPGRTNGQCRQRWSTIDQMTPHFQNTGRWTGEEDAKLTEAVTEFGNEWVRVAALVPGRTNNQCNCRWVKFLDPNINKGKWTLEEDAKLTGAVKKHGGNHWAAVAAMVPGRTDKQCRYRWAKNVDPDVNRGKWTVEEDAKLTKAVTEFGNDWVRVAAMVPGRTNGMCFQRWSKYLSPEHSYNARPGTC
jgi:hypothetical protein